MSVIVIWRAVSSHHDGVEVRLGKTLVSTFEYRDSLSRLEEIHREAPLSYSSPQTNTQIDMTEDNTALVSSSLEVLPEELQKILDRSPPKAPGKPTKKQRQAQKAHEKLIPEFLQALAPEMRARMRPMVTSAKKERSARPVLPVAVPKPRPRCTSEMMNPVEYLCILDFEATCNRHKPAPKPIEIIEFPTVLLHVPSRAIHGEFHYYIRPEVKPSLTDFCTALTGITRDMVDGGVLLRDAMQRHKHWLQENSLQSVAESSTEGKRYLYVTCGDWDLGTCLPQQLKHESQYDWSDGVLPAAFQFYINIKKAFSKFYKTGKPRGMAAMLKHLGMDLEGRHHSGIDDCRNIARICRRMMEDGWKPSVRSC